ncbi:hypothetical protein WICMUC_005781 [Wickerhamomyces mucosus]|uniref:RING-type domain-containing protein n=1 Tax=Wickerhamomyces mucosus TaxID=1378264 RepID=A0A9P8T369_9ASCO|nr:hypothetical protein WICMUC_005781 [Wickerhamomyces mucosus]
MAHVPNILSHNAEIFNIAPVQFQTEINNISCLDVSNDIFIIGFKSHGRIFRIDLNNPEIIETLELPFKKSSQESNCIEKIFQDPTGHHLIVSTSKNESFYIHKSSTQFKYLNDLKNIKITSIGWNDEAITKSNTGAFLIGEKSGGIHEAFLEYNTKSEKYQKKFVKNIYQSPSSIDGLTISFDQNSNTFTILLISGDDISYWNEAIKSTDSKTLKYNDLFLNKLFQSSPIEFEKYQDLGTINADKFCSSSDSQFAWLTAAGIVFGKISPKLIEERKNISELKFLINLELPSSPNSFSSITLTKYHLILLRENELLIINKLNDELVFQQFLPSNENEKFIGLNNDVLKSTYWIYSNSNIYEITVNNEEKFIWKAMCENHQYEEALTTTSTPQIIDIIYSKQGDYYFNEKLFEKAAISYSNSSSPSFETIALKFLDVNEPDALQKFFLSKFEIIKRDKNFDFKLQLVMLSSWIIELYITKLNELDDLLKDEESTDLGMLTLSKTQLEHNLQNYIVENIDILDKRTVYEIITSHNRLSELLYYANLIHDFDFVLSYWIRLENWNESIKVLSKINDHEIVYKYSTVLLINSPANTIESWLKIETLDPSKLLPAILTYNNSSKKILIESHHGVQFLLRFIKKVKCIDPTVHDTLLYILISNESTSNENLILRYLEENGSSYYYNPDFILRLCLKFHRIRSAVFIYSILNYHEDAVNLALKNNLIDEAAIIADKLSEDKTRKFLYLKIAQKKISVIRPSDNKLIKNELKYLLQKCELLTIKDLLPLLPDFTTIDNFKDEICEDLERFGNVINKLTREMESSITINEDLIENLKMLEKRSQVVKSGASCSICSELLISRKFFLFPCNHTFHSDCLIKEILSSNDYKTKKKLEYLQKKYLSGKHEKGTKFINDYEVDKMLSEKCPLCSDLRVETIDEPLVDIPNSSGKPLFNDYDEDNDDHEEENIKYIDDWDI